MPSVSFTLRQRRAMLTALARWARAQGRALPWTGERDPYRVWLREIMLQQTTVTAVIPYLQRFLDRFPTVAALAAADETEVLRLWEGLGYYSRARNLHRAARTVVQDHGGEFPREVAALRALPGIGRYTAGAIASFAFDEPVPILEANTLRLHTRLLGYDGDPRSAEGQRVLWGWGEALVATKTKNPPNPPLAGGAKDATPPSQREGGNSFVPPAKGGLGGGERCQDFVRTNHSQRAVDGLVVGQEKEPPPPPLGRGGERRRTPFTPPSFPPSALHQALIDLGATVCTPTEPRCPDCPLQKWCQAFQQGRQHELPRLARRTEVTHVTEVTVAVRQRGRYLLRRRPPGERWAGLWDFPRFALTNAHAAETVLIDGVRQQAGLTIDPGAEIAEFAHSVTRYRITLRCFTATVVSGALAKDESLAWVKPGDFAQYPLSVTGRKLATLLSESLFQ